MVESRSDTYRPDIDGLRAVAVVSVAVFHAFPRALPGGFAGVDVFFVISGFLISSIVLDECREGRFTLANFYTRRVRRLFPALCVVLAFVLVAGRWLFFPSEFRELSKQVFGGCAFIANLVFLRDAGGYFGVSTERVPLVHLWSLAIEEQFYLFWPIVLWLVATRFPGRIWLALCVSTGLSFLTSVVLAERNPVAGFYLPFSRMWELLLGAALAAASRPGRMRVPSLGQNADKAVSFIGAFLLLCSMVALNGRMPFPGAWALLPTVATILMIAAGPHAWINRRILGSRPFVFVGRVSYPFYLWHWPLLAGMNILETERPASHAFGVLVLAFGLERQTV